MTIWLIDPHEPLIFREGKPFEATPGAHAKSLPFPFPSTTAGALRSQTCLNKDGVFELKDKTLNDLKAISVRGPLLVSVEPDGETIEQWLIPAPADALLLNVKETDEDKLKEKDNEDKEKNKDEQAIVRQLLPLNLDTEQDKVYTDFSVKRSDGQEALQVIGLPLNEGNNPAEEQGNLEKPHKKAPRYWCWAAFEQWLSSPSPFSQQTIAKLGTNGPVQEMRVHVAMDHDTRAGKEGRLFDTSGLEFTHIQPPSDSNEKPGLPLHRAQRLALALITDDDEQKIKEEHLLRNLGTLGGERRLVSWRKSASQLPCCPEELKKQIIRDKRCRLFLLTPAYFSQGYRPTWLCQQCVSGVQPKLKAIAIHRPQVVSGWDMAAKPQKAKPSRRLAPAGTVLFLELKGNQEEKAIEEWIDQIWFSCISDDIEGSNQYRLDGFGLAVLGAWPIETY